MKVSSTSRLIMFALVGALGPFLAYLVAADHDCACWCNFQTSCSPASEEAACTLLFENMIQKSRHGHLLGNDFCGFGHSLFGTIVSQMSICLPSCFAHVEWGRDECCETSRDCPRQEAIHEGYGMRFGRSRLPLSCECTI